MTGTQDAALLVARLLLGEELERVEELPVGKHLVVEVIPGGAARGADVADDVAAVDLIAFLDREREQVTVLRLETEPVVEDDQVAVVALIGRSGDPARGRRVPSISAVKVPASAFFTRSATLTLTCV